jgi:hypothetical protein
MRTRRIVQIATDVVETKVVITVLCDDGTMWLKLRDERWDQVAPIPQPRMPDPFEGVGVGEQPEGPPEKLL